MSGETLSNKNEALDNDLSPSQDFEPFNPERAEQLRAKAKESMAQQEKAKEKAAEVVRERFSSAEKDSNYDFYQSQLEEAGKEAEYAQRKLAENYERASRIETGDPVPVGIEEFRFGKVFIPKTPDLDSLIAGEGSLSRPIELMPMMEESSKNDGSFKILNAVDREIAKGRKLSRDDVMNLAVRYLAYQEQRQNVHGKKEQQTYDNAIFFLENRISQGLGGLGEGRKIEPDSEIGAEISRRFARLKLDAFQKASPRRQRKFAESMAGKRDLSAIDRFSRDFSPQDLVDDKSIENPDISNGGVWEQNKGSLRQAKNEEARYREQLQKLGVE